MSLPASLRDVGAGIGLRREHWADVLATPRRIDWLEVVSENFMTWGGRSAQVLDACARRWRVIPHGVCLDVGGPDPLDEGYLERLAALADRLDAPFVSDHLCYARLDGVYLHDLMPLPASPAAVEHVVPRARDVARRVGRPLVLENPSYYAVMPGGTLDEATFLRRVLEGADCGLLLDVNNVVVNALNHGYDPRAFVDALPLERVRQVHVAGHEAREGVVIDTHGEPVPEPVWDLLDHVLGRTGPVPVLVEWDFKVPPLDALLDQADRARAALAAAGGATCAPGSAARA